MSLTTPREDDLTRSWCETLWLLYQAPRWLKSMRLWTGRMNHLRRQRFLYGQPLELCWLQQFWLGG